VSRNPDAPAGRIDAAFTLLLLIVASWSVVGLVLADLGWFARPGLVVSGAIAAAVAWAARGELALARPTPAAALCWAGVWIVLAVALFGRPGEYFTDGSDGSVYLNVGAALDRRGTLRPVEPLAEELASVAPGQDSAAPPTVLRRIGGWIPVADLFPGAVQIQAGDPRARPDFFHLLPVWIATFDAAAGPPAGTYVSAVFGVLSVLALWLLCRQLMPLTTANAAALLLTLNFSQIWFARTTTSEVLTQFFVLSGLTCALGSFTRPSRASGTAAGAAFGLAAATRIDVLVLVTPVVALVLLVAAVERRWSRALSAMAVSLTLVTALAVAHALVIARPYTLRIVFLAATSPKVGSRGLLSAVGLLAGGGAIWWAYRRWHASSVWRRMTRLAAAIVVLVLAARLLPIVVTGPLSMLLTPWGVGLGLLGAVLMLGKDRSPAAMLLAGIFLASLLVYGESPRDRTAMPMLFRRYVPVVVPLAVCLAAYVAAEILSRAPLLPHPPDFIPAGLAKLFATKSRQIVEAAPMLGVYQQFAEFAASLPAGALIVTDGTTPSHLGLTLHDAFGFDVLVIQRMEGAAAAIRGLVVRRHAAGRPVYLLVGIDSGGTPSVSADDLSAIQVLPARHWTLHEDQLESTTREFPSVITTVTIPLALYRLVPAPPARLPLQLEIGDDDASVRVDGFYGPETMGTASGRWTRDTATIALPQVDAPDTALMLRLRLAAPRPSGMPSPAPTVEIDGESLGATPPLTPAFEEVVLPVPPAIQEHIARAPTHLVIRAPTFVPAEHGSTGDTRQLGVAVDWVMLEAR
jgi:4-amino-4-deoxy-L-arabinose transferase-like glycosyltransferase